MTIRIIACGPPGVFTLVTRECHHCGVTGDMVQEYRGLFYGTERFCLTCRTSEEFYDTDESRARWDAIVESSLLPNHLYDAYVATDEDCYSTDCDTVEKEHAADDAHRLALYDIREYRAVQRDIREALAAA